MTFRSKHELDVLHVIGAMVAGGAERFVVDLVVALKGQGLAVGLLVLSSKQDAAGQQMKALLDKSEVPYECGPTSKVALRSLVWFIRRLQDIDPRIVHLHTQNTEVAYYLSRKLQLKRRILFRTIHNTNIPPKRLHWRAMRGNDVHASIACSEAVKSRFEPDLCGPIVTIRNGISFDWAVQTNREQQKYQSLLGLSQQQRHFISVGHQSGSSCQTAAKAHDIVIKAWREGSLGEKGGVLHLLGNGNLHAELIGLAGNDPSIVFHGIKKNIHEWMLAADCFVMPSRYEGLPIAAIEALGSGLPCIFSDIGPLRELDAPVALWVPVDDVTALADRFGEIIELRPNVQPAQVDSMRHRYGIEITAKAYLQQYSGSGCISANSIRVG